MKTTNKPVHNRIVKAEANEAFEMASKIARRSGLPAYVYEASQSPESYVVGSYAAFLGMTGWELSPNGDVNPFTV